jgi:diguanylate cyclase (GGDEF)-like protein
MRAAARACEPLCVAMLDLDRFKAYNDTLGHLRGDHLLRAAAVAWEQELRPGDRLARYGGEEFLVLLSGCDVEDAVAAVERLRAVTPEGQTCSAGLARWDGRESAAALFERVDAALYSAKATGRDRTVTAVPASPAATSSPSALKKRALGPA